MNPNNTADASRSEINRTVFSGLSSSQSDGYYPPDPSLAVGPTHLVEMVNRQGAVWYKQNNETIFRFRLDQFFMSGSDDINDPKIIFDTSSKRWFSSISDSTDNSVHIGVSVTENPLDDWYIYRFPFSNCPDQPYIGLSNDKLVVSANTYKLHCKGGYGGDNSPLPQKVIC